jgi:two-component system chemotaxis response regulator CheY
MTGGRVRVLVADDDAVSRLAMTDALGTGLLLDVTTAEDGASAWDALKGGREAACFDLVCLDVRMPPPDGLELAERIRHTPALKRLPVMLITSTADRQAVQSATTLQLQGFLVKPVTADTVARISKVLQQLDDAILEPSAATIARLRIDAERHARYVAAFAQQVQALAALAARIETTMALTALRIEFVDKAAACRTAALTLGAPRIEQVIGDAVLAVDTEEPGAGATMAQAAYWLRRVAAVRGIALAG